ncbi:ABC transporter domain-containing protein, partial [Haematococcus lacustris]
MVLQGVDLRIHRGTLHMILGPNGCGKSTLLKVLGGLVPATSGQVSMDLPTGFVFQNPDHQVIMPTVAADVAFGLGRYDLPADTVKQAVHQALRLVNMERFMSSGTHTLSGGQRQRVAIAGALAEGPRVLLLDELTTFLDMEDQFAGLSRRRDLGMTTSLTIQGVKGMTQVLQAMKSGGKQMFTRFVLPPGPGPMLGVQLSLLLDTLAMFASAPTHAPLQMLYPGPQGEVVFELQDNVEGKVVVSFARLGTVELPSSRDLSDYWEGQGSYFLAQ